MKRPETTTGTVVGQALQHYRAAAAMTQAEVAEAVEVSLATVSRWENYGARTNRLWQLGKLYGLGGAAPIMQTAEGLTAYLRGQDVFVVDEPSRHPAYRLLSLSEVRVLTADWLLGHALRRARGGE